MRADEDGAIGKGLGQCLDHRLEVIEDAIQMRLQRRLKIA